MIRLRLLAAAAILLASCAPDPHASRSTLALATCRLPGVDAAAQCGSHEVWENRDAKSGRKIALNIAIIPARIRAREPDPIVVFAGGPGQGAVSLASHVMPQHGEKVLARGEKRLTVFVSER